MLNKSVKSIDAQDKEHYHIDSDNTQQALENSIEICFVKVRVGAFVHNGTSSAGSAENLGLIKVYESKLGKIKRLEKKIDIMFDCCVFLQLIFKAICEGNSLVANGKLKWK